ncbi:CheR family methyltransferase [Paenibacillus monticola]|uniref:Protein-glutamate O-methyltransferase CheR n=1 Tax=Paenibacillus monticola TaxID=2666075 RepID=A0A7X2L2Q4_9BACL|nr:protein-glutamate O-methyltransferase CheR [Paenibacillus monticola]MRN55117.1 protein-glutamate O-methyltransferase CheR [Paenibacillus monticola]
MVKQIMIDLILETIHRLSGFDYSNYNRNHIERRLNLRMSLEGFTDLTVLLNEINLNPLLLNTILNDFSIQVTTMFRDPLFFLDFRRNVIPILKLFPEIYVWHAGCSTGEEAYSMAILLKEEGLLERARIYATDISEEAISKARMGKFSLYRMKNYSKNYSAAGGEIDFSEYYSTDDKYAYFDPSITNSIYFHQHNLVVDGSINEFHVILCRNVCIYFNSSLQKHVHQLFHASLHNEGFLCLGDQESIISLESKKYFQEFDAKRKIYKKNDHFRSGS